jgi:hypothetical protein
MTTTLPITTAPPTTAPVPVQGSNLKEIIIYSAIGLVMVGGSIYLGTKMVKTALANTEEKKSLDPDSGARQAKQIRMAFDNDGWWGTDEEALRRALRGIPDKKTFLAVAASYKRNYGTPLTKDMQEELSSTEYDEMMNIIAGKPEEYKKGQPVVYNYIAWAKRLYAAMSVYYGIFPGTDEDAIKSVFLEIPTQAAYTKVKEAYLKEYGNTLMYDLEGDLSQSYIDEYMAIIRSKPKA